jgi:REP element-mobilizing transposase RayT
MKYDHKIHHRRSIRLQGYDYSSPGAYYVTLCSFGKQCIFGRVVDDQMQENECGKIVRQQWFESAQIRQELKLDAFTVMPNHLHGILWIVGPNGVRPGENGVRPSAERVRAAENMDLARAERAKRVGPSAARPRLIPIEPLESGRTPFGPTNRIPAMRPHSLGSWASGFKSAATTRIRKHWNKPHAIVWQEDYFEHVIRDEDELNRIRDYILSNPARWKFDHENPDAGPDAEDEWPWTADDVP